MNIKKYLALSIITLNLSYATQSLCKSNEIAYFECILENQKRAYLCAKKSNTDILQYRFGTKDNIEYVYPKKMFKSRHLFKTSVESGRTITSVELIYNDNGQKHGMMSSNQGGDSINIITDQGTYEGRIESWCSGVIEEGENYIIPYGAFSEEAEKKFSLYVVDKSPYTHKERKYKAPPTVRQSLCEADEDVYFTCTLYNEKIASLCAKDNDDLLTGYVQYRFGSHDKIELSYPSNKKPPLNMFTKENIVSGSLRGMVLTFSINKYRYELTEIDTPAGNYSDDFNNSGEYLTVFKGDKGILYESCMYYYDGPRIGPFSQKAIKVFKLDEGFDWSPTNNPRE